MNNKTIKSIAVVIELFNICHYVWEFCIDIVGLCDLLILTVNIYRVIKQLGFNIIVFLNIFGFIFLFPT